MQPRRLHRTIGIGVAFPLLLLIVTGLPLQFTEQLALDRASITWGWVHAGYGVKAPDTVTRSADVVMIEDEMLVGVRPVTVQGTLVGAVNLPEMTLVATDNTLLLVPHDPDMPIERQSLAYPAERFAIHQDSLIIASDGMLYASEDFGLSWRQTLTTPAVWANVTRTATTPEWARHFASRKVSWERWLVDLHSGRFFGPVGEWIMSLASAAVIVLSITGLIVWLRRPAV